MATKILNDRLGNTNTGATWIATWRLTAVVFVVALFVYSLAVVAIRLRIEPTGDEPHYLVVARSIAYDFDLDVSNNYLDRHWKGFFGGELGWAHAREYRPNSGLTSVHPVGLPAFIALPYLVAARIAESLRFNSAWAGYLGSVAAMVLVASALATVTFRFLLDLVGNPLAAGVAWTIVFFTNPMLPYSSQLYPETLAALALMIGLWLGWRGQKRWLEVVLSSLAVAVLPWLHSRYLLLALILFSYLSVRLWAVHRRAIPLLVGLDLLAASAYILFQGSVYGSFSPAAAYGSPGNALVVGNLPVGLAGLFVDQSHGLFVYAPVYVPVLIMWLVLVFTRFTWKHCIIPVAALLFIAEAAVSAMHPLWFGGWSIPPRFLVPVIPLAGLPLATSLAISQRQLWRQALRLTLALLGAATLAVVIATGSVPAFYFDHFSSKMLIEASKGLQRLTGVQLVLNDYWPMMIADSPLHYRPLQAWGDTKVGVVQEDQGSPYRQALELEPGRDPAGFITGLSYVTLRSGRYLATAHFKFSGPPIEDAVAIIYATVYADGKPQTVVSREVRGLDFSNPNGYQAFDLEFSYSGLDPLTLRVYYTGKARLWFGGMSLARR